MLLLACHLLFVDSLHACRDAMHMLCHRSHALLLQGGASFEVVTDLLLLLVTWAMRGLVSWPAQASPALFKTFVKWALPAKAYTEGFAPQLESVLDLCSRPNHAAPAPALQNACRYAVLSLLPPIAQCAPP